MSIPDYGNFLQDSHRGLSLQSAQVMDYRTRKPNRLQNYDYSRAGHYFVTICTYKRKELFGEIVDGRMIPNAAGRMVATTWHEMPKFYQGIRIDQFQIMPNHVHGIIVIVGDGPRTIPNKAHFHADGQPQGILPTLSLSGVVHRFKTLTTRLYIQGVQNKGWKPFNAKFWQRSFYDHVIRNDESLDDIRAYIKNNPINWALDEENPAYQTIYNTRSRE